MKWKERGFGILKRKEKTKKMNGRTDEIWLNEWLTGYGWMGGWLLGLPSRLTVIRLPVEFGQIAAEAATQLDMEMKSWGIKSMMLFNIQVRRMSGQSITLKNFPFFFQSIFSCFPGCEWINAMHILLCRWNIKMRNAGSQLWREKTSALTFCLFISLKWYLIN